MSTLTPFGPLGTTDDTEENIYRQRRIDDARHADAIRQGVEHRFRHVQALDALDAAKGARRDAGAAREEVNALKRELEEKDRRIEELELDKATYRQAAVSILQGRKAALNTIQLLAQAWGKPLGDPEKNQEFLDTFEKEREKIKSNTMATRGFERHVEKTAAQWRHRVEEQIKKKKRPVFR